MMLEDVVRAAARNNADWCAAVCRSHGLRSRILDNVWTCDGEPPPYYPRLISLAPGAAHLEKAIDDRRDGSGAWAVKDSFGELRERPGLSRLFDAQWYVRHPRNGPNDRGQLTAARDALQLTRWVDAWGATPPDAPIFLPQILDDPGVTFLHDGLYRGGLAAYHGPSAPEILGISNLFGPTGIRDRCLASLAAANPGWTLVGYGAEEEVAALSSLGFGPAGRLTIWRVNDAD
ncbi:MAG: hypothetical protein R3D57_15150 [Hyphomicrobiaceae bacterium]